MGRAGMNYQRIIIDVCDPELTKCWVFIQALGDCPFTVQGWHFKAFGGSISMLDVLEKWSDGTEDPVMWPRVAPEEIPREAAHPAAMPPSEEAQEAIERRRKVKDIERRRKAVPGAVT